MAILTKDTTRKQVVDLTGPQGNAFYLLGLASKLCKQLQMEDDIILQDMKMGGYEHLITTFDDYFGDYIDLERQLLQTVTIKDGKRLDLYGNYVVSYSMIKKEIKEIYENIQRNDDNIINIVFIQL